MIASPAKASMPAYDCSSCGRSKTSHGKIPDGIEARTRAVMENIRLVLAGLDLGFEQIVMARIYLTRFKEDYAAMNATYRSYFAVTCVGVTGLAYDALIEIDLVCRRPS
jgi:2-iminobutanoate/2-iminopropanoate deaminase